MKKIDFRKIGLSIFLTILGLYILGNANDMKTHFDSPSNAYIRLISLQIFIFISMFISIYYVISTNLIKTFKLLALVLAIIAVYFTFFIPLVYQYQPPLSQTYILLGNVLRDVHGINWYWMDWGNWMITAFFYFLAIYMALFSLIIKLIKK